MSTRANILIKDNFYDKLWFYRHSDGYPEGTLPTLQKYVSLIKEGKLRNNASQSAGWLIIIGAIEYQTIDPEMFKQGEYGEPEKLNPKDWKVGAYEPTTKQHGDIDYLYVIDLQNLTIQVQNPDHKVLETVKV